MQLLLSLFARVLVFAAVAALHIVVPSFRTTNPQNPNNKADHCCCYHKCRENQTKRNDTHYNTRAKAITRAKEKQEGEGDLFTALVPCLEGAFHDRRGACLLKRKETYAKVSERAKRVKTKKSQSKQAQKQKKRADKKGMFLTGESGLIGNAVTLANTQTTAESIT